MNKPPSPEPQKGAEPEKPKFGADNPMEQDNVVFDKEWKRN